MDAQMEESFGDLFRRLRRSRGFKSQKQLAAESGISQATISRIEDGTQKPQKETLTTLAKVLGITPGVLFYLAGYIDLDDLGWSDFETGEFSIMDKAGNERKGLDAWEYRKNSIMEFEDREYDEIMKTHSELLNILDVENKKPLFYNGQLLKQEEIEQILLMLKALFPEYSKSLPK
jgi:transcriptional regulator with XRE-family HTH domain